MVAHLLAPGETYTALLNRHHANIPAASLAGLVAHAVWKLDDAHDTLRAKARLGAELLTRVANDETIPEHELEETTRDVVRLAAAVKTHHAHLSLLASTYQQAIRHLREPPPPPAATLRSTFTQASVSMVEAVPPQTANRAAPGRGPANR